MYSCCPIKKARRLGHSRPTRLRRRLRRRLRDRRRADLRDLQWRYPRWRDTQCATMPTRFSQRLRRTLWDPPRVDPLDPQRAMRPRKWQSHNAHSEPQAPVQAIIPTARRTAGHKKHRKLQGSWRATRSTATYETHGELRGQLQATNSTANYEAHSELRYP